ncbi:hypothetical protein FLAG1_11155 [Fusarium langsethiae]|uniref:Uncharacterized protein n=1 Tax=Fusarium langsethiae TaxID=179993 RepID=A0A0N0DB16_FUSLA|nr:hypothetical protein FLAG1_11155 [Fusarium langsethiae]
MIYDHQDDRFTGDERGCCHVPHTSVFDEDPTVAEEMRESIELRMLIIGAKRPHDQFDAETTTKVNALNTSAWDFNLVGQYQHPHKTTERERRRSRSRGHLTLADKERYEDQRERSRSRSRHRRTDAEKKRYEDSPMTRESSPGINLLLNWEPNAIAFGEKP